MIDEGKYLYCIIEEPNERNFGPMGIGKSNNEVYTIGYRDLSCVVSTTPMTKYVISPENLMAHEKVIEKVMEDYTVLPFRFCTIATSLEEVRSLQNRRYREFKNLLRSMDNKVELGLKVWWKNMKHVFGEISTSNKEIRKRKAKLAKKGESLSLDESTEIGKQVKELLEKSERKKVRS